MSGYILLAGGAEFGGRMAEADRRALELAGGIDAPVAIIPTAAAPDHNDRRAGQNGVRWFQTLGAKQVRSVPLVDARSAADEDIAAALRQSRLIYLLGGFPGYLADTLAGSLAWQTMLEAYHSGAVLGGSSAGAMVLVEHYYDPDAGQVRNGLNLLPGICILPHHNNFGKSWAGRLRQALPAVTLVGIEEQTGIIDDKEGGGWMVYGKGEAMVYGEDKVERFQAGEVVKGISD